MPRCSLPHAVMRPVEVSLAGGGPQLGSARLGSHGSHQSPGAQELPQDAKHTFEIYSNTGSNSLLVWPARQRVRVGVGGGGGSDDPAHSKLREFKEKRRANWEKQQLFLISRLFLLVPLCSLN